MPRARAGVVAPSRSVDTATHDRLGGAARRTVDPDQKEREQGRVLSVLERIRARKAAIAARWVAQRRQEQLLQDVFVMHTGIKRAARSVSFKCKLLCLLFQSAKAANCWASFEL